MRGKMLIHVEQKDLKNTQQMEVAVNGPDGATHLILCTGVVSLGLARHETYAFLVGPQISRRQFVGAIAFGALTTTQVRDISPIDENPELAANLVSILADYDDEFKQVKVEVKILPATVLKLVISYNVSILAELPKRLNLRSDQYS